MTEEQLARLAHIFCILKENNYDVDNYFWLKAYRYFNNGLN